MSLVKGPDSIQTRPSRWGAVAAAGACLVVLLGACTTAGTPPPAPPKAPPQASLQELMQRAETSAKEGRREASRLQYRDAAKAYPTNAVPWSKLAEDYFESGDHGNAILAAQEVVQREPQNVVAQSVLAVSGLRVSNTALAALRSQQSGVPSNTREQAVALTRTLREALGEFVLVPRSAAAGSGETAGAAATSSVSSSTAAPAQPAKASTTRSTKPAAKPAAPKPAVTKPAPAEAPPASSNPFDKLK
jgi:tetratricopeptide (TPR) repeat protein